MLSACFRPAGRRISEYAAGRASLHIGIWRRHACLVHVGAADCGIAGGHWAHARNFTMGLTLTTFVSGAMIISGLPTRRLPARNIELLAVMLLFWFVLPILASIPLTGAVQVRSFMAGYFEAVSGLTTSGGGVIVHPQLEEAPILIWRALLGWLGGLWTLVFAVAVLAPFAIGGLLVGSPLLQHDEDAALSSDWGDPCVSFSRLIWL